jgi:23S rRNA pseudouridine1911/1915/1917 synthase
LKYGASSPLEDKSIALHAHRLELEHPTLHTRLVFSAPAPAIDVWDFDAVRRGGSP